MITRADAPPLTAEQIAARRRLIAIVAVVLVFAAGYYLFALHAAADRDARRRPIQAKIDQMQAVNQRFASLDKVIDQTNDRFDNEVSEAEKEGTARHDNGVGSNPSDETKLEYAKKEAAQVDAAIADFQAIEDGYTRAASLDESILGNDAVQRYRTDTQAYTTAESIGLVDWSRAIGHIVDGLNFVVRDGSSSSDGSDIEHDYQMSDEQISRADADLVLVRADGIQLNNMRASRLNQLKMDLAAIK